MSYEQVVGSYIVNFDNELDYLNCRMEYLEYLDCVTEYLDSCHNSIVNGESVSFLEFIQTEAYDHSKCCVNNISQYPPHPIISDNTSIDTSKNAGFNTSSFAMSTPNYISNGEHRYRMYYDYASSFALPAFFLYSSITEPLEKNDRIKEEKKKEIIDDLIENRFDILDL